MTPKRPYFVMHLEGTQSEELMKWGSLMTAGGHEALLWVHMCPAHCKKDFVQDDILHLTTLRVVDEREDWMENCLAVGRGGQEDEDQVPMLRAAMSGLPPGRRDERHPPQEQEDIEASKEAKLKKKKKKQERKREQPSKAVVKGLNVLFERTGLDKHVHVSKFMRKARKVQKEHSTSSDSTSSASRSSRYSQAGGLSFGEEDRIRKVARTCPGGLTRMALQEVRNLLLVSTGDSEMETTIGPLFV